MGPPPPPRDYFTDLLQIEPLVNRFDALKTLERPKEIDPALARTTTFPAIVANDIIEAEYEAGERAASAPQTAAAGNAMPSHLFCCDERNRTHGAYIGVIEPLCEAIESWRNEMEDLARDVHARLHDIPAVFDREREERLLLRREQEEIDYLENRNRLPEHLHNRLIERDERDMHYKVLEIRNGGRPPSGFGTWPYVLCMVGVSAAEWMLNYIFMEHSFRAPWPAAAFVALFGITMAIASHLGGKLLKQHPYYFEFPKEKPERQTERLIFYFTVVLTALGIAAVSYARYQFLNENAGGPPGLASRGLDLGALPAASGLGGIASAVGAGAAVGALSFVHDVVQNLFRDLGSVLATVGFLAAANLFIFGIGVFCSYLHHDKVPGLQAAARVRNRTSGEVQRLTRYDQDEMEQTRRRYRQMREELLVRIEYVHQANRKLEMIKRELPDLARRYAIAKQADQLASSALQRYRDQLREELAVRSINQGTEFRFRILVRSIRPTPAADAAPAEGNPPSPTGPDEAQTAPAASPAAAPASPPPQVWEWREVDDKTYFRQPIRSAIDEFNDIITRKWR